jgi:fatty-acyl-CoA synthase
MKIIKGFQANTEENYQLNMINIMIHAQRNFARQEILSRKPDGSMFSYSYQDSYDRMKRLANSLESLGIKLGDRIGVLAWNTHQNFEIYFGLPGTGAVMVLLNLRLSTQDLAFVINHAKAKFLIVDESLIPIAEKVAPLCNTLEGFIVITENKLKDIKTQLKPIYSYEKLLSEASPEYNWPYLDENSTYAACYTTGTTGKPKGVYYSHRVVYVNTLMFAIQFEMSIKDVVFQLVPMFHVLGWSKPMAAAYVGAKMIFSGKWDMNDLEELTDIMVRERVTVSGAVPAVFSAMLELIKKMDKKPDLKGARFVCGGAEPPISLMKGMWDLCGAEIIHSYGSTEAMAGTTFNRFKPWLEKEMTEDELWNLKKKQGTFVSGLDVKIVDENGAELPHDGKSSGEILLRGPWVVRNYFNAPETEDSFTQDRYFKTGDAGNIDSEGYLKITDRLKDVIKSGGEWISSIDMENTLVSHQKILTAAVVGVKHPKWDERPIALIVLRDEYKNNVETTEIREHLLNTFAKWQIPEEIIYVDSIPRTSVGKIDKKVIRAKYKDIYLQNK